MTVSANSLIEHAYRLMAPAGLSLAPDRELLAAFITNRHQPAFSALVARHGSMVLNVCRRILGETHIAEDAFQATFLVLARKPCAVRPGKSLAAWLHGVAYRVSLNARRSRKRRPDRQSLPAYLKVVDPQRDPLSELSARELLLLLEEEVQRLPIACRLPVTLCCLDGLSLKDAAKKLGMTEGAVKGHLERGRARLHARLVRRGLTLSAALAFAEATRGCLWAGPAKSLVGATVQAATAFAAGDKVVMTANADGALQIAKGMLNASGMHRLKAALAVGFLVVMSALGAAGLVQSQAMTHADEAKTASPQSPKPPAGGTHLDKAGATPANEVKKPRLMAATGHTTWIRSVAFSPDGTQILTASADCTARLWATGSGTEIRLFRGHTHQVASAAFSKDGKQVLTASWDNTARLWDAASGKVIRVFEGHADRLFCATFSPDGRTVLTGSADKTARLWELGNGKELCRFEGHSDWILSVAFSPDGKQIVTASMDKTARLWDAVTGKETGRLEGHADRLTSAAFSPDGKRVLTGSFNGDVILWDTKSGQAIRTFADPTGRQVWSVAFSPSGKQVLTASWGQTARLWDTASGREIRVFNESADYSFAVALSPDGSQVVSAGHDPNLTRLWDTASGKEIRSFRTHTSLISSVAFSPDGRQILAANADLRDAKKDNTARLWDATTGKAVHRLQGHIGELWSVAFSPDCKLALTGSDDSTARLWDTASGKEVRSLRGHTRSVKSVTFSPDGKQVLTGSDDQTARLWDLSSGKESRAFVGHSDRLTSVAFGPDGKQVLTGSFDKTARLWNVADGNTLRVFGGTFRHVLSVAFSPDNKQVVTGGFEKSAILWEIASGKERYRFPAGSPCLFSPDGKLVASVDTNQTVMKLWDTITGREMQAFAGHDTWVSSAAFSPDGKKVLTGSGDGMIRLWDCTSGHELCRLLSFDDGTWAVMDPAGRYDSSNDGDIEWIHGVVANDVIPLKDLKAERYDPGLLAKYMGFNNQPLRVVQVP